MDYIIPGQELGKEVLSPNPFLIQGLIFAIFDKSSRGWFMKFTDEVVECAIVEVMKVELPEIEVEDDILELPKICSNTMKKSSLSS